MSVSGAEDWTLQRALRVAEKYREYWPSIPDERGRVPGAGYWVATLLSDALLDRDKDVTRLSERLKDWLIGQGFNSMEAAQIVAALAQDVHFPRREQR